MRPAWQRGDDGQVLVRAFEFKTRVGTDRPTSLRATVAHVTTIPRFLASCTRCSKMKNRNHKLLIFHLDWPVKKDPHKSGFPPSKPAFQADRTGLVGVFFWRPIQVENYNSTISFKNHLHGRRTCPLESLRPSLNRERPGYIVGS